MATKKLAIEKLSGMIVGRLTNLGQIVKKHKPELSRTDLLAIQMKTELDYLKRLKNLRDFLKEKDYEEVPLEGRDAFLGEQYQDIVRQICRYKSSLAGDVFPLEHLETLVAQFKNFEFMFKEILRFEVEFEKGDDGK